LTLALLLAGRLMAVALAEPTEVGVVFFGDSGTGGPAQVQVAEAVGTFCAAGRCDLLLLLGDNFMPAGVDGVDDPQWQPKVVEPYAPLGLPIRPVLGNHDHAGDAQAQVDFTARSDLWDMPALYYTFSMGPVAFFALDTDRMDWRQRHWLRRGLRHSGAAWNVVFGHHPLRSWGPHGPARGALARIARPVERFADFYLCGHEHGQQVLRGQAIHAVMASGGSPPREVGEGPDTLYAAARRGFGHLLMDGRQATLTVVEANGEVGFQQIFEAGEAPWGVAPDPRTENGFPLHPPRVFPGQERHGHPPEETP